MPRGAALDYYREYRERLTVRGHKAVERLLGHL